MGRSMKEQIHEKIIKNYEKLTTWYENKTSKNFLPFYSSYDIRDANFKLANIDGNIFPAGFNNICHVDKEHAPDLIKNFVQKHYGDVKKILLVTEDHLKNKYYWDNVISLKTMINQAGFEVKLGMPALSDVELMTIESHTGQSAEVARIHSKNGKIWAKDFCPDLVISNNDFSIEYSQWGSIENTKMNPPKELGWYQRKKSNYFKFYQGLVEEFSEILSLDPWYLNPETRLVGSIDMQDEESKVRLAKSVDELIANIKKQYEKFNIDSHPHVFLKNNAGTYGLGVIKVNSGQDILSLNYNTRKKLKASKGGKEITDFILQEGVPSALQTEQATAEPVIYMVGPHLVGGFLRTHSEKNSEESLNSPGAVYKRLCLSDLSIKPSSVPLENVYGWLAKLGMLAISEEAKDMGVDFRGYTR